MQMAQETVEILNRGRYTSAAGTEVDISSQLRSSVEATALIRPADWTGIVNAARSRGNPHRAGRIEVTAETTTMALRRLVVEEGQHHVGALNFASAKNAGGGFLNGSQAQEESLARASGLHATLLSQAEYYQANRACRSLLYTDHAIVSPGVPIIRD
jgi:uncharacterized protein (TIGR02452 family)